MQFPSEPVQRVAGTDRYLVPQALLIRGVAYLIDTFLLSLVAAPFLYGTSARVDLTATTTLGTIQLAVLVGISLYFFIWEGAVGWTPGKRLFQLRVVCVDGTRCGWRRSLVRNVIRPLDLFFFGIIGAMSMATGLKRQRVGDRAAGTMVVRAVPLPLIPFPYVPADQASRRCPACGALQPAERASCLVCGTRFDGGEAAPAQQPWQAAPPSPPGFPRAAAGPAAGPLAEDLRSDDEGTRLTAAREVLLEGEDEDVEDLNDLLPEWSIADALFVVSIARTLDGWRPEAVLEALCDDPDDEVATAARDALQTVKARAAELAEEHEPGADEAEPHEALADEGCGEAGKADDDLDDGPDGGGADDRSKDSPAPGGRGG